MVADVHFLADDPAELVAGKLLRVNLSDLAAMGAEPLGYLTALARSPGIDDAWLYRFAAGPDGRPAALRLLSVGRRHGVDPRAADAVADDPRHRTQGPGPATVRGAPGDDIWVSGTLGDAALGLRVLRGLAVAEDEAMALVDRYRTPRPRLALGKALRGLATAAIDVSDGLVADLGHIWRRRGRSRDRRIAAAALRRSTWHPWRPRGGAHRWRRLRAAVHGAGRPAWCRDGGCPAGSTMV